MIHTPYKIVLDDGRIVRGVTDEAGRTLRIGTGGKAVGLKLMPDDLA
jgi:hypothetical protein